MHITLAMERFHFNLRQETLRVPHNVGRNAAQASRHDAVVLAQLLRELRRRTAVVRLEGLVVRDVPVATHSLRGVRLRELGRGGVLAGERGLHDGYLHGGVGVAQGNQLCMRGGSDTTRIGSVW